MLLQSAKIAAENGHIRACQNKADAAIQADTLLNTN